MDAPQQDPQTVTNFGTIAVWASTGAIGAAFSALRKQVSMRQAVFHVGLSSFICSCLPYVVLAFWPKLPWYIGVPISMAVGLTIFGIAVMLERTDKRIESIDPTNALPEHLRPRPIDGGSKP